MNQSVNIRAVQLLKLHSSYEACHKCSRDCQASRLNQATLLQYLSMMVATHVYAVHKANMTLHVTLLLQLNYLRN